MSLFLSPANRRDTRAGANPTSGDVSVTSRFWTFVTGPWTDHRRELRIRDLRVRMQVAFDTRDHISVQHLGRELFAECDARSPRQVARMEKRIIDRMDASSRALFEKRRVQ